MKLAKDRLDVGLLTDDPAMVEFLAGDVGLGEPDVLRITPQVTQHRFDAAGSVVKVNVVEVLDTDRRSGFRRIAIARDSAVGAASLVGPDEVEVVVAPIGHGGVEQLGVYLAVPDRARAEAYFRDALGWWVEDGIVRLGASVVHLDERGDVHAAIEMPVRGWTYLTVQIHDCDAETEAACSGGATLVQAPVTFGDVARFSIVADPFGNQLELSQRASLTGPLPR